MWQGLFRYETPGVSARMAADVAIEWGSAEWRTAFGLSLIGVAVYVVGIPLALLWAVRYVYQRRTESARDEFL